MPLPLDYFWGYGRKEMTEKHWLLSQTVKLRIRTLQPQSKQLQLDDFSAICAVPIPDVQVRYDAKYVVTGIIMFLPGFLLQLLSNY